jgi:hypothetical protein
MANLVLEASDAGQTEVLISGGTSALTRFANNYIHQNVEERGTRLDFQGGKSVERTDWFLPTLRRVVSE